MTHPVGRETVIVRIVMSAFVMSLRDYGIGAQILSALGLAKIRLLSRSSRRVVGLDGYGLEIVEQVAL